MPATVDILAPTHVGESRLDIALLPGQEPLRPNVPITVSVGYDRALPQGVQLPLVFIVQPGGAGGAAGGYREMYYRVVAPTTLTFTVPGPGAYLVSLTEVFHNRWQGRLVVNVEGDGYGETIVRSRG
jgi:hypothetical protein